MTFYHMMANRYANRRTFAPETETGAGGAADAAGAEDGTVAGAGDADADADAGAGAVADPGQGGAADDGKQTAAVTGDKTAQTDDEKAALLKEVMDKKTKLKTTTKELDEARAALEAYAGVDPAKVKELVRKEAEAEQREAEARGDFDRVKQMMAAEHEREKAALQAERDAERNARAADLALIDELTIGNSFGNSLFIRDTMSITPAKVRSLYGSHFERKDGTVIAYDKPVGAKDRTMLVGADGEPLKFDEALSRIVDADPDKKGLLKSRAKPGANSASDVDKTAKKTTTTLSGAALIAANLSSLDE